MFSGKVGGKRENIAVAVRGHGKVIHQLSRVLGGSKTCKTYLGLTLGIISLVSLLAFAPLAAAATGVIDVDIAEGPIGTANSLFGYGFMPSDNFTVRFAATSVATGLVDAAGEVNADFLVPAYPRGKYAVTVLTPSDNSNIEYFTVTPEITLDRTSIRPGGQIKVTGYGFKASSTVSVLLDSATLGNVTAGTSGNFTNVAFNIPSGAAGAHTIYGKDSVGTSPGVSFTGVAPEITLNMDSGRVGSQISLDGTGFKPLSTISIMFDGAVLGTVTSDDAGAFSNGMVNVPHSASGAHAVTAKDTVGPSGGVAFSTLAPEISLNRGSGRVDDPISVSGLGFKPGSSVKIMFDNTSAGSVTADASGAFSGSVITVPPVSGGRHVVTGQDALNTSAGVDFEISQSMTISPSSGAVGEPVEISGSGFSKSSLTVEFDNTPIKLDAVVDASGVFTGSFNIPEAAAGKHDVRVHDNSGSTDAAVLTVVPKLTVSPDAGPAGTVVKAAGTGFNAADHVSIKYNGAPVITSPASIETDARGSFFASFEVPPSLPGAGSVEASDAGQRASTVFNSVLAANISQLTNEAAPGHVGMQLSVNGAGFKPNARIIVTRATIQEELGSTLADANGIFEINFAIPPSPSGRHTIIVTDGTNKQEFDFFLEAEPPATPLLLQPDADKKVDNPVLFDWKDVADASGVTYTIQIARDERFDSIFKEEAGLGDSELLLPGDLLEPAGKDNPYYWRVKATDGAMNESQWSEMRPFTSGFTLTLPNGETEMVFSAWTVYLLVGLFLVLVAVSFWLGRKTSY
jgi:hypothetical protein